MLARNTRKIVTPRNMRRKTMLWMNWRRKMTRRRNMRTLGNMRNTEEH